MKKFILQAVTAGNHFEEVCKLLAIKAPEKILISTAYMRETGLFAIEDRLEAVAEKTELFVGIRNGVTTAQALKKAISLGCAVYVVDTGISKKIFHPKMYFSQSEKLAKVIIGSANLTLGGLSSNIEASILESFDLENEEDKTFVAEIAECYSKLKSNYPKNVFRVTCEKKINELLITGRVTDENTYAHPVGISDTSDGSLHLTPKMELHTNFLSNKVIKKSNVFQKHDKNSDSNNYITKSVSGFELVWVSKPLTRRDLNIPDGNKTNPTGSMNWAQGAWNINKRQYFRNDVFSDLEWKPNLKNGEKEEAEGEFLIVIQGINHGKYQLTVTNDTRTNTKSYAQGQPMSALRWGKLRNLIAKDHLLKSTLELYRSQYNKTLFLIDID